MQYSNFANHAALRQALKLQFEIFADTASDGFSRGLAIPSGQPVTIAGVSGASYELNLDPHQPKGVCGHLDGMPGGTVYWRPDFQRGDGSLDAAMLVWASGVRYAEGPVALRGVDSWLFMRGIRLRWRRSLLEARIVVVRALTLSSGALPSGCGRLQAGGHLLLALRRFSFDTAAVMVFLPSDSLVVALHDEVAA